MEGVREVVGQLRVRVGVRGGHRYVVSTGISDADIGQIHKTLRKGQESTGTPVHLEPVYSRTCASRG